MIVRHIKPNRKKTFIEIPQAHYVSLLATTRTKDALEFDIRALSLRPEYGVGLLLTDKVEGGRPFRIMAASIDDHWEKSKVASASVHILKDEFRKNMKDVTAHLIVPALYADFAQAVQKELIAEGVEASRIHFKDAVGACGIDVKTGAILQESDLCSYAKLVFTPEAQEAITEFINAGEGRQRPLFFNWINGGEAYEPSPLSPITLVTKESNAGFYRRRGIPLPRIFDYSRS